MTILHLLKLVASGKTSFEPNGDTESEMRSFQPIAAALLEAEALGYIEIVKTHRESDTGFDYYDTIIAGCITETGLSIID